MYITFPTAPDYYNEISMDLTFDPQNLRLCISITSPDDGLIEGPEEFTVRLTPTDSNTPVPAPTTVVIEEDEGNKRFL